jgi:hypothetical protein
MRSNARASRRSVRHVVRLHLLQRAQAVVDPGIDLDHVQPLLEQADRGHEVLPLQPVRIELVGRVVRGHHEHDLRLEQRLQEAAQDHRVGDVGHVELVEAHEPPPARDARRHRRERIRLARERPELVVHGFHEGVEVHARLAAQRHGPVERVHEEALAASDAAPEVDAARRRGRPEQAPQARRARRLESHQLVCELLQPGQRRRLRMIERRAARGEQRIEPCDQAARARGHLARCGGIRHEPVRASSPRDERGPIRR